MEKLKLPKRKVEAETEHATDEPKVLTTKRKSRQKPAPIPSSWSIFKSSLSDFRDDWKPYSKIVLLGAVLVAVLSIANASTGDATTAAYISVFTTMLNITVIWSISYRYQHGNVPDIRTAYYDSSAVFVRFMLTFFRLLLTLIPAALGSAIYQFFAGELVAYADLTQLQATFVVIIAALLWLPTLYWISRRLLSLFIIVSEDVYPGKAWRRAQELTAGRFWQMARYLVLFVIYGLIVAIPSVLLLFIFSLLRLPLMADIMFQLGATVTILPIGYMYLYKLYRELDKVTPRAQTPAPGAEAAG